MGPYRFSFQIITIYTGRLPEAETPVEICTYVEKNVFLGGNQGVWKFPCASINSNDAFGAVVNILMREGSKFQEMCLWGTITNFERFININSGFKMFWDIRYKVYIQHIKWKIHTNYVFCWQTKIKEFSEKLQTGILLLFVNPSRDIIPSIGSFNAIKTIFNIQIA